MRLFWRRLDHVSPQVPGQKAEGIEARGDRDFVQWHGCGARVLARVHPTYALERGLQDDSRVSTPDGSLVDRRRLSWVESYDA